MREGLQGIYARIIWSAQLHFILTHGDITTSSDAIYPASISSRDEAVLKELVDAGRSPPVASSIYNTITTAVTDISHKLTQLSPDPNSIIAISPQTPTIVPTTTYTISYTSKLQLPSNATTSFAISGQHLAKLLRLYRLYTNAEAAHSDNIFVRLLSLVCTPSFV